MLASLIEGVDHWGRRDFAALLFMRTGKWPDVSVLGQPARIEHPDRPKPEVKKSEEEDEAPGTDPARVAAFFKPN